ncbi:2-succinyl-5-enolpyruvyl-6-hydroxy-3-cyclohexene-1-carboxylic-acid synthase [Natroniella sulfidigena]|uniref:2-succinyl-5-enolpyruvyl-6-hydroxy-3- cyclohexene-1-carboxylic-acid synthase n=1 Tax=Natroniella sulfidigena TaxID=723921 RepID=UPI00200B3121|nr:2-succinyl-5-enolpyruvyl-6-hydroxy-3-cyclohexene-1-carboxylic-acid synthase [Natroniella sulfidigena]MCK8817887.1 2-succinyl-5-enolpyruvyl-6-hydroxy-3-cyclohexene-1-carboxylic-acid synthase [Natroniella sulfidigena]
MNKQQITHDYVTAFVDELVKAGLKDVCLCPGSRSTPLAMILAQHQEVRVWRHIDERSAAFFALGRAKVNQEPVALVCTSGTAAANFLPAVIEANYSRIPLVVLTADRPPELQNIGAPQAIDQMNLYGSHAKWSLEMALPEATEDMLRYVRTTAGRAVATAKHSPAGPVHLNFPFRKPLVPLAGNQAQQAKSLGRNGRENNQGYVTVTQADPKLAQAQLEELATELDKVEEGLIVCGPQIGEELPTSVIELANQLDFPILADPLSQIRCGKHNQELVIDNYDAFLRNHEFCDSYQSEVIIRFGAMPTSKAVFLYLKEHQYTRQLVIDGGAGWHDPTALASEFIYVDPDSFCSMLAGELKGRKHSTVHTDWSESWLKAAQVSKEAIEERLSDYDDLFEGRIFTELAELLPDKATLVAGNSMPVRDLDTFFANTDKEIKLVANRGANGIDGVVSTALGVSTTTDDPVILVIGDLSFYHDLNGLLAAKLHQLDLSIIVVNNDGGGIFSFLPQANYPEYFEELFGTPIGLDFEHAVQMYQGEFIKADTWPEFNSAIEASMSDGGLQVIEVCTDREINAARHREMWEVVTAALRQSNII